MKNNKTKIYLILSNLNIKRIIRRCNHSLAIIVLFIIFFILAIWLLPMCCIDCFYPDYSKITENVAKINAVKELRAIIAQIGAGILALFGFYLTFRRTKALENQNILQNNNLEEIRKKNEEDKKNDNDNLILQQFSKASELLKDQEIAARLSGIYLFEKIMNSSEDYHWQIIELLSAYVREKRDIKNYDVELLNGKVPDNVEIDEETKSKMYIVTDSYNYDENKNIISYNIKYYFRVLIEKDIQAILTVIGRRERKLEKDKTSGKNLEDLINDLHNAIENGTATISSICYILYSMERIDLRAINLYKADLRKGHFENVNFSKSQLINSNCEDSHFEYADCLGSHFEHADCLVSHFEHAKCSHSHFENAFCRYSHFDYADCLGSHFEYSDCINFHFEFTICNFSHFEHANCSDSHFEHAELQSSNFKDAKYLTAEQLSKAKNIENIQGLSAEFIKEAIKLLQQNNPKETTGNNEGINE